MRLPYTMSVLTLVILGVFIVIIESRVELEKYGKPNEENLPIILWWDGLGRAVDLTMSCDHGLRCFATENKTAFHEQEVMIYGFYGTQFLESGLPFPRREGDLWALLHEESPKNVDFLLTFDEVLNVFNYSATFKRESHFPLTTHWLPDEDYLLSDKYMVSTQEKNRYRNEKGFAPVLFVHSDCTTPSNREGYVEKLMEYVKVDSYGSCLHNKDFPEGGKYQGIEGMDSEEFLELVGRYKFTFAFENALCDDYITEKLWRPLHVGSVPIVKGSSKVKDFLPSEKSALLIDDLDSIEELGKLIKRLDVDDDEYEEYLKFKTDGVSNSLLKTELKDGPRGGPRNFGHRMSAYECFLCKKLHGAIVAKKDGNPIPRAHVDGDHLDCPLPSKKWNDKGEFIDDPFREKEIHFYQRNAEEMMKFYNKRENITSTRLYKHTHNVINSALKEEL